MKKLLVVLAALVIGISATTLAGVNLGLGTDWHYQYASLGNGFGFSAGVGYQGNNIWYNALGWEIYTSISNITIYDVPDSTTPNSITGFDRACLTLKIPGTDSGIGPVWYIVGGLGIPVSIAWDDDNIALDGTEIGILVGLECETSTGHGLGLFFYMNEGTFRVGLDGYVDLAGLLTQPVSAAE